MCAGCARQRRRRPELFACRHIDPVVIALLIVRHGGEVERSVRVCKGVVLGGGMQQRAAIRTGKQLTAMFRTRGGRQGEGHGCGPGKETRRGARQRCARTRIWWVSLSTMLLPWLASCCSPVGLILRWQMPLSLLGARVTFRQPRPCIFTRRRLLFATASNYHAQLKPGTRPNSVNPSLSQIWLVGLRRGSVPPSSS